MKLKSNILFAVLLTTLFSGLGFAAEEHVPTVPPAAVDLEMQAKMAEMEKYSTPNENHKALEPLAGNWKSSVKFWVSPESAPEISEGTSHHYWTMGGRFLQYDFKGTAMGKPFEGMGITGYDTVRAEYTSLWLDNMATGITVATAQFDPSTRTLNQQGTMSCAMTMEKNRSMRSTWKIIDNNRNVYEAFMNDKDGKEFRAMEIIYERVV